MTLSLEEPRRKLAWANTHFEILRSEIEAFEQGNDYTIMVDINPDVGEYVFYVVGLKPLNNDWDLRIGDCIHNARVALDYLAVRLLAYVSDEEPRDITSIEFPIYFVLKNSAGRAPDLP